MEGVDTIVGLEGLPAQLKADNSGRLAATPTQIVWTGWLLGRKAKETPRSKVIVEFDNDRAAGAAMLYGLALNGENHHCTYYDTHHKIQQCFNC
jgi:hypothetical protein